MLMERVRNRLQTTKTDIKTKTALESPESQNSSQPSLLQEARKALHQKMQEKDTIGVKLKPTSAPKSVLSVDELLESQLKQLQESKQSGSIDALDLRSVIVERYKKENSDELAQLELKLDEYGDYDHSHEGMGDER